MRARARPAMARVAATAATLPLGSTMRCRSAQQPYALVKASGWAFTLTDDALRMPEVFHCHQHGTAARPPMHRPLVRATKRRGLAVSTGAAEHNADTRAPATGASLTNQAWLMVSGGPAVVERCCGWRSPRQPPRESQGWGALRTGCTQAYPATRLRLPWGVWINKTG